MAAMSTRPATANRPRAALRFAAACAADARAQAAQGLLQAGDLPELLAHWRRSCGSQRPWTAGIGGDGSAAGAGVAGAAPAAGGGVTTVSASRSKPPPATLPLVLP